MRKQIDDRSALDVIRHGVDMVGVKGRIELAQFRPAFGTNPDILAAYRANRLRVVRQLRYSAANENAIDVALFLNGAPRATACPARRACGIAPPATILWTCQPEDDSHEEAEVMVDRHYLRNMRVLRRY